MLGKQHKEKTIKKHVSPPAAVYSRPRKHTSRIKEEEKYRYLFEQSPAVSFVVGLDGAIQEVNRAILESTHYEREDLIGRQALDFVPSDDRLKIADALEKVLRGQWTPEMEVPVTARDGSVRTLLIAAGHAYIYESGMPVGALMTGIDITEYKRVEEKLRNAVKMEGLIGLSGVIAHDFNNLLTVILNYAGILLKDPRTSPEAGEMLQEIHDMAHKAEGLTRKLMLFGQQNVLDEKLVNLAELLARTEKRLSPVLGDGIALKVSAAPGLWSVRTDAGLIEEVIANLVTNSAEAMPGGGVITVKASNIHGDEPLAVGVDPGGTGRLVRIAVADEGQGMDRETVRLAFEPFFTTRPKETHPGLGLSIVYGAVKQCGGSVSIESTPGKGTMVKILFPAAP
jgi:two-component system cell cycle sensor histidine kinase/response regulator CckA